MMNANFAVAVSVSEILKDFPELENENIHIFLLFTARRTDFLG
jgi:uncharacterized protein (DUF433 family)